MDSIFVRGGRPLRGEVAVSGAKNAALPVLCATLLADGRSTLHNVPRLRDVGTTLKLLRRLGLSVVQDGTTVVVDGVAVTVREAPYDLVKQMRASVLVLGPLVARYGEAKVSLPGGCAIGARPIDQHLKGLEAMGATVALEHGYVHVVVPSGRLAGAAIDLDSPTVTGTENLMMAAALAKGRTVITNPAREPEIEDLAAMLNQMGARISGAGSDTIEIDGVEGLRPAMHRVMPDRIEAGTYMVAAAATGGDVLLKGVAFEHVEALAIKLRRVGVVVESVDDTVRVGSVGVLKAVNISTGPYPGFPTDMQAQWMTLMTRASGSCQVAETVFENRFMHVSELNRMGARIEVRGRTATVTGVGQLEGAPVMATDLRASASLVIAGLMAEGETEVLRAYHIDRGYERIEEKLQALGGDVRRGPGTEEVS